MSKRDDPRPPIEWEKQLFWLLTAWQAVVCSWYLFDWGGPLIARWLPAVALWPASLVAAVLAWRVACHPNVEPELRRSRRLVAWAFLLQLISRLYWAVQIAVLGTETFPTVADVIYLGGVLAMVAAAWSLPRDAQKPSDQLQALLDVGIALVPLWSMTWVHVLQPMAGLTGAGGLDAWLLAVYPSADLILFASVASTWVRRRESAAGPTVLLKLSIILLIAGDLAAVVLVNGNTFLPRGLSALLWLTAGQLSAWSMYLRYQWVKRGQRADVQVIPPLSFRSLAILIVGMGLLITVDFVAPIELHSTLRYGTLLGIGLTIVRMALALYQNDRLQAERDELQERRLAEATLEAATREREEVRDRFLQIAAHELRNPMAGVLGMLSLMRLKVEVGAPLTDVDQMAATMEHEIERLSRLLNEIQDAFRTRSGQLPLQKSRVDLVGVVTESLRPFAVTTTSEWRFVFDHPADTPVWLMGDERRLEDVMRNLLGNALKYSPSGGEIAVRLAISPEGSHVTLSVSDEGIGIPANQLRQVLEGFVRGQNLAGRDPGGLGLGLYISHEVIRRHDGRLWLESMEGKGTTVYIELPLAD